MGRLTTHLLTFSTVVGVALTIVGLGGLSDDLATWAGWIDMAASDPRVIALAEQAVQIAEFVNQWWFRVLLVSIGVLLIAWNWRFMTRLRRYIGQAWRHSLGIETWVPRPEAVELIRRSDWAQSRKPSKTIVRRPSPFFALSNLFSEQVTMSESKEEAMLKRFSDLVLNSIVEEYPNAVKNDGGKKTYLKETIESWLVTAFDDEVLAEFGAIPSVKLK